MTLASHSPYARPAIGWTKRRARHLVNAFGIARRTAVVNAAADFNHFTRPDAERGSAATIRSADMPRPTFHELPKFESADLNRAVNEGYSARRGGRAKTDNPYPEVSMPGATWQDGWIIADAQLHKANAGGAPIAFAPGAIEVHRRPRPAWLRGVVRHALPIAISVAAMLAAAVLGFAAGYLGLLATGGL